MSENAQFDNQPLIGAAFRSCDMARAQFEDIELSDARFTNVNLQRAHIHDANLTGAVIDDANVRDLTIRKCAMARAQFEDIDLADSRFTNVNLQRAHVRDANLTGAVIDDANISGLTIAGHDIAALIRCHEAAGNRPAAGMLPFLAAQAPRAFLPTRDFAISTAFYEALGFIKLLDGDVAIFSTGPGSFILQRRYDPVWAENCMMQLMVEDLDAWWAHILALDLPGRFSVTPPRGPEIQPWGLRIVYLVDPAGVLWHIAERRADAPCA